MLTQSVIPVCLLLAAVCVRAEQDDEAPLDMMEPPQEATPAPVEEGNTLHFCFVDGDCRVNNDAAATCVNRDCQCSAGFGPYTYKNITLHGCFASTEDHSVPRQRSQQGHFARGNYGALTPSLKAAFLALWGRVMGHEVIAYFFSKGSVNYVVTFEASDNELIELAGKKSELIEAINQENPALKTVLAPESLSVATAPGGQEECERDNAAEAIVVEGVCHAQQCNAAYRLYTASSGVQICVAGTRGGEDDDALSKGEIAGIAIASVVSAALLAAAVAFVCKANAPKSHDEQQVFAGSPKNAAAPEQQDAEAATPAPVNPAAGHSLYTAPYGDGDMEAQSQFLASNVAFAEA